MIKAVLFDLDDTLYPEIEYVKSGFDIVGREIYRKFGIKNASSELFKLFSLDKNNVFDRYLALHGLDGNFIEKMVEMYRNHEPNIKLSAEVENELVLLRKQNYKLGIITDGRPIGQKNKIRALGLEKLTDKIIITDELGGVEFRKPNVKAFEIIFAYFSIKPAETVYVGDNPKKDFVVGKLGVRTVRLLTKGLYRDDCYLQDIKPQYSINDISEIERCLND